MWWILSFLSKSKILPTNIIAENNINENIFTATSPSFLNPFLLQNDVSMLTDCTRLHTIKLRTLTYRKRKSQWWRVPDLIVRSFPRCHNKEIGFFFTRRIKVFKASAVGYKFQSFTITTTSYHFFKV